MPKDYSLKRNSVNIIKTCSFKVKLLLFLFLYFWGIFVFVVPLPPLRGQPAVALPTL